jgi:anti-sigma B factor antagonist
MFDVTRTDAGHIVFQGRLDASQADRARKALDAVAESCIIDFGGLDYISSAGLGILLATQKRLSESGHALAITRMNRHIRDVFHIAGFDLVFTIE